MSRSPLFAPVSAREKAGVLLLTALVVLLGSVINLVSPPFEPPDERLHYQFVRDLLDERRLPVQLATAPPSQSHQPPLYYLGGALLVFGIADESILPETNPFWAATNLADVSRQNKRQFLPHPAHRFPYRGTALVVHVLRLWSTLLAAATAVSTWHIARLLWPRSPHHRLTMTALVVLNPMFLYLAGSVNNDNLLILLSSLLTLLTLLALQKGFTYRRAVIIGLLWGAALLTKLNGLVLAGIWGTALLWQAWQRQNGRFFLTRFLSITLPAVPIAGWWFLRNVFVYGDPLALNILLAVWGERSAAETTPGRLGHDLRYAFTNFWGRFGYGQIPLPRILYLAYALLCGTALTGGVRTVRQRRPRPEWVVLTAGAAAYAGAFLYFLWRNPTGANGRYVFPALPAYAALLVAGFGRAFPTRRAAARGMRALAGSFALVATLIVGLYLPWVYAPPATYASSDALPPAMQPLDVTYAQTARLLGYKLSPATAVAGQKNTVTLYWQPLRTIPQNYYEFVHVVTADGERLTGLDTHPGLGHYPTTLWQPGEFIADPIPLDVPAQNGPIGIQIHVGLSTPDGERLRTESGGETVKIGALRLAGSAPVTPPGTPTAYRLGEIASLVSIDPPPAGTTAGSKLSFHLTWQARQPIAQDYQAFIHLVDAEGTLVATYDGPPADDFFPTRLWQAGDVVVNSRHVTLPPDLEPGRYQFLGGWYTLADLVRLPATTADGTPLPAAAIPLFEITVE